VTAGTKKHLGVKKPGKFKTEKEHQKENLKAVKEA